MRMQMAVEPLDTEVTRALYERMYTIRRTEELILDLFAHGRLAGTTHTCIGQEACAVGVVGALDPDRDFVFSNHRSHGHYIAHGGDLRGLFAELMGRATGVCAGVGGSQHLCARNFYSNGVQGGIVPIALGMALAEKWRESHAVGAVFLGDGTCGEGVVYESFNMAALWEAPLLFVIEDNGYAQSTPTRLQHAGDLVERPRAFGIETFDLTVQDVTTVRCVASAIVSAMRCDRRPRCLVLRTYRLVPHSVREDLRPEAEIEAHRRRDPLLRLRAELPPGMAEEIEASVEAQVAAAAEEAAGDPNESLEEFRHRVAP